jgi:hypothetical protein
MLYQFHREVPGIAATGEQRRCAEPFLLECVDGKEAKQTCEAKGQARPKGRNAEGGRRLERQHPKVDGDQVHAEAIEENYRG